MFLLGSKSLKLTSVLSRLLILRLYLLATQEDRDPEAFLKTHLVHLLRISLPENPENVVILIHHHMARKEHSASYLYIL